MSKILCVGDLHLNHTRLKLCASVLEWIEEVVVKEKIDDIVYLGDVFNDHSVIRSECLCIWSDHLSKISKLVDQTYWLQGNHDQFRASDNMYTVLKPFEAILPKDIHAITYPCEINGLGFVPYLNNESWETVQPSTEIVFTHNTFVGADFGFKIADGGIPLSSVSCDLVVSGHIHKQQILQDKHTKIVYPGTPYAWSANDVDQHKSLMVLDTETLEMYAVASPMSTWRKIQIDLPAQSILVPASIRANDHLLVKLVGLRADVKAFAASSAIYDLKQRYASVSLSTEFLDSAKTSNTASIKANTTSDALDQYLKSVYKGSASVEDVRKEILSVLEMT